LPPTPTPLERPPRGMPMYVGVEILAAHSRILVTCSVRSRLIPEYGGPCAVRERTRASGSQGHGSVSGERPPIKGCNDVAVDGLGQACFFVASFGLPFALHGYANEETAHEAPRLASAEV
jgi:hypothetical protein